MLWEGFQYKTWSNCDWPASSVYVENDYGREELKPVWLFWKLLQVKLGMGWAVTAVFEVGRLEERANICWQFGSKKKDMNREKKSLAWIRHRVGWNRRWGRWGGVCLSRQFCVFGLITWMDHCFTKRICGTLSFDSQEDVCKVPREFWGNYNLEEKKSKKKCM